jgi:hypothetical protein
MRIQGQNIRFWKLMSIGAVIAGIMIASERAFAGLFDYFRCRAEAAVGARVRTDYRAQVLTLDRRVLMSGPGVDLGAFHHLILPQDGRVHVDVHKVNLGRYTNTARLIFREGFEGQIPNSVEPEVNQLVKQGLAHFNVPVVAPGQEEVERDSAFRFDNGGVAVERKFIIHPGNPRKLRAFAVEVYYSPQGTAQVYFAPTDPNAPDVLMVGPPPMPLTAQRLGTALVTAFNEQGDGVTFGPVPSQNVGAALLQALLSPQINVPQNPFTILVDMEPAEIGNGGHSLGIWGGITFNEVFLPYWFSIEVDDNGNVSCNVQRLVDLPPPTLTGAQKFPFTGLPQIFYMPLP